VNTMRAAALRDLQFGGEHHERTPVRASSRAVTRPGGPEPTMATGCCCTGLRLRQPGRVRPGSVIDRGTRLACRDCAWGLQAGLQRGGCVR
jgi:hypothetical protein